jgi:hypothetical protein
MPVQDIVRLATPGEETPTRVRETLAEVQERLRAVNETLEAAGLPYRLWADDPRNLKPAPKNARFMRQEQFQRLVDNVRSDGGLESLPFCWRQMHEAEGTFTDWLVSGHHRRDAAVAAGLAWILYLYTDAPLTESQRIAKQLAHNAIAGEDNQAVLAELYQAIESFEDRKASGVDDVMVGRLTDAVQGSFQDAQLEFEEVSLLFLPKEAARFKQVVEKLTERSDVAVYAADRTQWDGFFQALLRYKERANIVNTSTAVAKLVEIANAWCDEQDRLRALAEPMPIGHGG